METAHSVPTRRAFIRSLLVAPVALGILQRTFAGPAEFSVALIGFNGGLSELLESLLEHLLQPSAKVRLSEYERLDAFTADALRQRFDLHVVFLNPWLHHGVGVQTTPEFDDLQVISRLGSDSGQRPLVVWNRVYPFTEQGIMRTGAAAVLGMPFSIEEFRRGLNASLDQDIAWPHAPLRGATPAAKRAGPHAAQGRTQQ